MTECAFCAERCRRTDCSLLLARTSICVSATKLGFGPRSRLDRLPLERVRQIHLAGHSQGRDMLVDTHDAPVPDAVWALYARFIAKLGDVAVMIERDDHIPPLAELLAEVAKARDVSETSRRHAA